MESYDMTSENPVTAPRAEPSIVSRQAVLTQTLNYVDHTVTTMVTLAPGSEPTNDPLPPVPESTSSDGLTPSQVGIIVGSVLGAAVFILLLWCCCVVRQRRQAYYDTYVEYLEASLARIPFKNSVLTDDLQELSDMSVTDSVYERIPPPPRRTYWPPFPRSIPPPVVPDWRARAPSPQWTAHEAGRRGTTYIY
ncbi:hypothetical protein F5Y15DRAFT_370348 [Xylariaceae sp. FL0016]|nr:hypothetical protein F5Y15DRAFT_370348 [Xylariaceae sp. FL0016]